MKDNWKIGGDILRNNGIIVLPTDTLYGIIGSAFSKKVIERIYRIKKRNKKKPFIVLIISYKDLDLFGVKLSEEQLIFLKKVWPGKVSVILNCPKEKFKYLHRGTKTIAFRMIGSQNKNLFNLIKKVGPIVAPSANLEREKPIETIGEIKGCFGDKIDLYVPSGPRRGNPSKIISLINEKSVILRK